MNYKRNNLRYSELIIKGVALVENCLYNSLVIIILRKIWLRILRRW
jgi:hypothetical protein